MAKLSDKDAAELARLQGLADAPDDDESWEVEYWEEGPDGTRRGGRMPYAKGKAFFERWAPDLFGAKPADDDGASEGKPGDDDKPGEVRRFGRKIG